MCFLHALPLQSIPWNVHILTKLSTSVYQGTHRSCDFYDSVSANIFLRHGKEYALGNVDHLAGDDDDEGLDFAGLC